MEDTLYKFFVGGLSALFAYAILFLWFKFLRMVFKKSKSTTIDK